MLPEENIKNTIIQNLPKWEKYDIFLFWSRAKGNYHHYSDYDIWIQWEKKLKFIDFLKIKSALEELPYLIDIVDFNNVDENFKHIALKNIKKWN